MGIAARIETERGRSVAEVLDPKNYVSWIASSADLEATLCLRFIDPYGDTDFNGLQFDVMLSELESVKATLSEDGLALAKKEYLENAKAWPKGALDEARSKVSTLSLNVLLGHLDQLILLIRNAIDQGPHHYVRFVGD